MKQFFKTKFFYIITIVALLFTIVPIILNAMGVTSILKNTIGTIFSPLQKFSTYATEAFDGFAAYFYKFDRLVEENEMLREQIEDLQKKTYDAVELEKMYDWMSDFLEVKIAHADYKFLAASVIGHESGAYSRVLTLDVGTSSGVKENMPVISSSGLVGRITEVGLNWSKVTTLTQANSSVGAFVERTGDTGICTGVFDLSSDGLMEMNYVSSDSTVAPGDRVLSSGNGSVYPANLVVGFVDSVDVDPNTRGLAIKVKCSGNFTELTNVMIITSYDIGAK